MLVQNNSEPGKFNPNILTSEKIAFMLKIKSRGLEGGLEFIDVRQKIAKLCLNAESQKYMQLPFMILLQNIWRTEETNTG